MGNLPVYLLQASAGTALLYLVYFFFYRNDTLYRRNRFILLMIMITPAIIPFIRIEGNPGPEAVFAGTTVIDRLISSGIYMQESVSENLVSASDLLFWIWLSGTLILISRTIAGIVSTLIIIRSGEMKKEGKMKIIISDLSHQPFSFCNAAVIPRKLLEEKNCEKVLIHEKVHISQMHSIDLIISEIFTALFWFNPAAWLIRRSVVLNHEYLADSEAISRSDSATDYQFELLSIPANLRKVPFAHNYTSNLKSRIVMINKNPTSKFAGLKSLITIPAIITLFMLFSFKPAGSDKTPLQQQELFSAESRQKIMQFIFMNIQYPAEAKNANITGRFYVIINMGKGGKPGKVYTDSKDKSIKIPLITENDVVVMGYGTSGNTTGPGNSNTNLLALENEAVRVAKMLGTLDLPEWKGKKMKFAFSIDFQLKSR